MAEPRLSVCIVHWNTPDDLAACVDALEQRPYRGPMQIVVVDNASTVRIADDWRAGHPNIRFVDNPENRCYAEGCNQAVDVSDGDLILLLNPDTRVGAGALDKMVDATREGTRMVSARLVWPDGRTQASVRGFPTPGAVLAEMLGLARCCAALDRWRLRHFPYDREGVAPQPMASCWMIPRAVWDSVGLMDPRFPLYFNDVDWAWRAHQAGWETWHVPDAVVVHDHGGTTKRVRKAALWESRRAFLRYWNKHHRSDPWLWLARWLVIVEAWARTGRWGHSLAGETTPESLQADFSVGERGSAKGR